MAYDGKGNYVVKNANDIPSAVNEMTKGAKGIYAEKFVNYKKELAGNPLIIYNSNGRKRFKG
jgi:phosphoribosylaminoimidazole carboxylase